MDARTECSLGAAGTRGERVTSTLKEEGEGAEEVLASTECTMPQSPRLQGRVGWGRELRVEMSCVSKAARARGDMEGERLLKGRVRVRRDILFNGLLLCLHSLHLSHW